MTDEPSRGEPYLRVEDVAERLGLPLSVLMGRVQAGDIPSRREEDGAGVRYWLRLGDLGIEADEDPAGAGGDPDGEAALVGDAIQSSFNPGQPSRLSDDAPWSLDGGLPSQWPGMETAGDAQPVADAFHNRQPSAGLAEPARPDWLRVPEQPSPGMEAEPAPQVLTQPEPQIHPDPLTQRQPQPQPQERPQAEARPELVQPQEPARGEPRPGPATRAADPEPATEAGQQPAISIVDAEPHTPADTISAVGSAAGSELGSRLPVPQPAPRLDLFEPSSPRGDLATMSLDARELVAGLLDRWERTLEQRIYTEQRQRFESELAARQNAVKQLQMELHTARAEHAAAQADKDRMLAEKERELADRERDIADAKRHATEPAGKRRRWFRRADD